ncbi:MAG: hypothetical protein HY460_00540 [Parcubacteria group bacterium]|nr:hypothetical protein [Parcubacteria group bacterium]
MVMAYETLIPSESVADFPRAQDEPETPDEEEEEDDLEEEEEEGSDA